LAAVHRREDAQRQNWQKVLLLFSKGSSFFLFFFEKKNQKTFAPWRPDAAAGFFRRIGVYTHSAGFFAAR
jgi:hypothetical protein